MGLGSLAQVYVRSFDKRPAMIGLGIVAWPRGRYTGHSESTPQRRKARRYVKGVSALISGSICPVRGRTLKKIQFATLERGEQYNSNDKVTAGGRKCNQ